MITLNFDLRYNVERVNLTRRWDTIRQWPNIRSIKGILSRETSAA